jgi:hypothetical protein
MHHHRKQKKKAPASVNWTGALKRKGSTNKVRPLTPLVSRSSNGKASHNLFTANGAGSRSQTGSQRRTQKGRLKIKEQWLREELRANRTLMLGLFQWGLAVLTGMETVIYYVRRDVASNLALHNALPPNGTVPPTRWLVGTAILTMVAIIFCLMSKYLVARQVAYRGQLVGMKHSFSGIIEGPMKAGINKYHYWLFLAFPAMDVMLLFYFRLTSSITIPW